MGTKCLIRFDDNPNKVFYGGQMICGTVLLTLAKELPVKGIYIEVTGAAKCRWCEHVQQKRMTYRGSEVYLSARKHFVGGGGHSAEDSPLRVAGTGIHPPADATGSSTSTVTVPRGEHVYNFTCALPVNLPTSFEGTYGHIRYRAEVTVNIPLWPDKTFAEGFTVIRSVDLNGLSDVRNSSHVEKSEMFNSCCLMPCLQPKRITLRAALQRTGFTAGQTFDVSVDIENNSDISLRSLTICLLRIIVYCANERGNYHKTEHVRYSSVRTLGCKRQSGHQLKVLLQVPAGPPTDSMSSTICRIRYEVEIRTDAGNCHGFPVLRMPVTIGTFPLLDNPTAAGTGGDGESVHDPRISVISYDPDLPSYEQAMAMNAADDAESDAVVYSPVYPVYESVPSGL